MNPPTVEAVLRAYVEVWREADSVRRAALLDLCWSEESEIVGPGYHFKGRKAVLDEVARFPREQPGFRPVLTSGFDVHGRWVRFAFVMLDPRDTIVDEGWDVVELAADGRIARVISFWGKLPPPPEDMAERVLLPPRGTLS